MLHIAETFVSKLLLVDRSRDKATIADALGILIATTIDLLVSSDRPTMVLLRILDNKTRSAFLSVERKAFNDQKGRTSFAVASVASGIRRC